LEDSKEGTKKNCVKEKKGDHIGFCLPSLFFLPLPQFLSQVLSLLYDIHDGTV